MSSDFVTTNFTDYLKIELKKAVELLNAQNSGDMKAAVIHADQLAEIESKARSLTCQLIASGLRPDVVIDAAVRHLTDDPNCLGSSSAIRARAAMYRRAAIQYGYKSSAAEAGANRRSPIGSTKMAQFST